MRTRTSGSRNDGCPASLARWRKPAFPEYTHICKWRDAISAAPVGDIDSQRQNDVCCRAYVVHVSVPTRILRSSVAHGRYSGFKFSQLEMSACLCACNTVTSRLTRLNFRGRARGDSPRLCVRAHGQAHRVEFGCGHVSDHGRGQYQA